MRAPPCPPTAPSRGGRPPVPPCCWIWPWMRSCWAGRTWGGSPLCDTMLVIDSAGLGPGWMRSCWAGRAYVGLVISHHSPPAVCLHVMLDCRVALQRHTPHNCEVHTCQCWTSRLYKPALLARLLVLPASRLKNRAGASFNEQVMSTISFYCSAVQKLQRLLCFPTTSRPAD